MMPNTAVVRVQEADGLKGELNLAFTKLGHRTCAWLARFSFSALTAAAFVGSAQAAANAAIVAPAGTPPSGIVMRSVLDLQQRPGGMVPQLRGGVAADSKDWPVSFFVSFQTPWGVASCTAVLVGPRALLTAAHCVPVDKKLAIAFGAGTFSSECEKNDRYEGTPPDESADFALCRLDAPFSLPDGQRYETIDMEPLAQTIGKSVLLAGYGCASDTVRAPPAGPVACVDHKYRIGTNVVVQSSLSTVARAPLTADYYQPGENNNLMTDDHGANLCPGDSGGPAFEITVGVESGGQYANRFVVAVNSRVIYRDHSRKTYGASLLSSTGGPAFRLWATRWANAAHWPDHQSIAICGVAGTPQHCRGTGS